MAMLLKVSRLAKFRMINKKKVLPSPTTVKA